MGFDILPHELKYKISEFLDTKSLVSLIQSGQKELDNNFIWKQKCQNEYSFFSDRVRNWKEKYKKLYLTKCIHCLKNTKLYNEFYKVKVCRKCELQHTKYHTLSYTKAKKNYFLNDTELNTFKFIYRTNPYNYTQKIKLYLKDDIMRYIVNSEGKYIDTIQQRMDIYRNWQMNKIYKLNVILSTLIGTYNISENNLTHILGELNRYSKGLFQKFIRYNNRSVIPVINKALELDFIFTYTDTLDLTGDFESILYSCLLSNIRTLLPVNINDHIDLCIHKFNKKYRDCLMRKKEVLIVYNEIKHRNSVFNILKIKAISIYIKFGTIFKLPCNSQLKAHILLHNFLYVNTDIQTIIFEYNIIGKIVDKYSLYMSVLNKWYINNPQLHYILPKELYSLILI